MDKHTSMKTRVFPNFLIAQNTKNIQARTAIFIRAKIKCMLTIVQILLSLRHNL